MTIWSTWSVPGRAQSGGAMGFWQQTASWPDFAALTRRAAPDEDSLRRKFWRRLMREAAHIPF